MEALMNTQQKMNTILEKWNLLKHPFYQAWSAGTVPVEALQVYAREYGGFIEKLPGGWERLGDPETAEEEREHAELWADFTAALGGSATGQEIPEARQLVETADGLWRHPVTALGGLYAFEAQQPATASSKLEGLKAHYRLPGEAEPYFEIHAANQHESEKLLRQIEALPEDEQEAAAAACEQMAQALWEALSGIYRVTCV
jgi:pyrroloquinoline-quinone synthase